MMQATLGSITIATMLKIIERGAADQATLK
jgi:hypothetical protein